MTIYEERRGSVGILSLNGSFVGKPGASLFERAIFGLLKDDCTSIILDLAELKFIDSAGLGAIIAAMVSVGRREGALKLADCNGDAPRPGVRTPRLGGAGRSQLYQERKDLRRG